MEVSRITSKYQATVPADVRAALGVKAGDRLAWEIGGGVATVSRVKSEDGENGEWLNLVGTSLADEWLSPEDEEAFRDLQPR